ncbi:NUDIX hydrolase [Aestuariibaculum sediminum]|uniref:CoA pyrophosphatase n=1 Tax=Aestuariibaculum sediminum TaxID=2770637 RepID=A0A8J6Q367_9FLAO|nr:CoA pyrophosphatase [Aestuariibaculum sediminum]MBD0833126.1 CoA pyrophosphatase [Aestuariibaculum sediminum]
MNFDEFLLVASKIKNIPLPAESSQFKMVPSFRHEELRRQKDAVKQAKQAGVMALFYPKANNKTHIILILRKTYKGVHSAQVGFPGGKLEPEDDSIEAAAVRETFEEVGVPMHDIKVVRELSKVYIPPSNFYVFPFFGYCKWPPKFIKQDSEVERLIEVPLSEFLDDNNVITNVVKASYSAEVEVPAFKLNEYVVWGATAMMLSEIKDLLKTAMLV